MGVKFECPSTWCRFMTSIAGISSDAEDRGMFAVFVEAAWGTSASKDFFINAPTLWGSRVTCDFVLLTLAWAVPSFFARFRRLGGSEISGEIEWAVIASSAFGDCHFCVGREKFRCTSTLSRMWSATLFWGDLRSLQDHWLSDVSQA